MKRRAHRRNRWARDAQSVADKQAMVMRGRPLVLPEGADPELAKLIGLEVRDV